MMTRTPASGGLMLRRPRQPQSKKTTTPGRISPTGSIEPPILPLGDLYSTLRDRSIVITLERATPRQLAGVKRYRRDDAQREASAIVREVAWYVGRLRS